MVAVDGPAGHSQFIGQLASLDLALGPDQIQQFFFKVFR